MELQKLMDDISKFSSKTFGEGQRNPAILYHLKEEVDELIDATVDYHKHNSCKNIIKSDELLEKLMFEYADCLTLILDSADNAGLSAKMLIDITRRKLEINKKREWEKPDIHGVCRHKK